MTCCSVHSDFADKQGYLNPRCADIKVYMSLIVLEMILRLCTVVRSMLADVVILTPSDENVYRLLTRAAHSIPFVLGANHLAVFKRVRANWKPPY